MKSGHNAVHMAGGAQTEAVDSHPHSVSPQLAQDETHPHIITFPHPSFSLLNTVRMKIFSYSSSDVNSPI